MAFFSINFELPPSNSEALVFLVHLYHSFCIQGLKMALDGTAILLVAARWRKIWGGHGAIKKNFEHCAASKSPVLVLIWYFGLVLWCEGAQDGLWPYVGTRDGSEGVRKCVLCHFFDRFTPINGIFFVVFINWAYKSSKTTSNHLKLADSLRVLAKFKENECM